MTSIPCRWVIGVDAGGTKTTAWLDAAKGASEDSPIGTGHAGPGNMRAVGFDSATQQITTAIQTAWEDAGETAVSVDVLCLCVAGAGRQQEQDQLQQWALSQRLANRVIVTGDGQPILAAASPENVGIALVSGTGSLAWGRSTAGQVHRVGGWGYLLGDDGSGYAIAAAGLRAASRAADGRGEQTVILDAMIERLGCSKPSRLIEAIYGSDDARERIAACADVVFAVASDDLVAQNILNEAGTELATMVTTLSQKCGFRRNEFVLALAGGVLMHHSEFKADVIRQIGIRLDQVVSVPSPVAGALAIARQAENPSTSNVANQYRSFS